LALEDFLSYTAEKGALKGVAMEDTGDLRNIAGDEDEANATYDEAIGYYGVLSIMKDGKVSRSLSGHWSSSVMFPR